MVTVRTGSFALNTSTGTQNVTVETGWGQPAAVVFWGSANATEDADASGLGMFFGATDSEATPNHWVCAHASQDGSGNSDTYGRQTTDECIMILDHTDGTVLAEATISATSSWPTDGFQINIGATDATAYIVNYWAVSSDASALAGTDTSDGTDGGTITVSGIGFEADQVIVSTSRARAFDDTSGSHGHISIGFADNDTSDSNVSISWLHRDNRSTSDVSQMVDNDRCCREHLWSTEQEALEFSAFTSTGWTCTTRDNSATTDFGYLALAYGGQDHHIETFSTPTSTGSDSNTSVGFAPGGALIAGGAANSLGTVEVSNTDAGYMYIAGWDDASSPAQRCLAMWDQDAQGSPKYTGQRTDNVAILARYSNAGTATDYEEASFTSWDDNGYTLNWSTVDATAHYGISLFIEEEADSGGIDGTASITFSASGDITPSPGSLEGTANITFSASGTTFGTGSVDGTSTVTFGGTSDLRADASVDGSAAVAFSASGTLDGAASISGTATVTFGGTSTLISTASIAGTASFAFSASGDIGGSPGFLRGNADIDFMPPLSPNNVLFAIGHLDGSAPITFGASASPLDTSLTQIANSVSVVQFFAEGTLGSVNPIVVPGPRATFGGGHSFSGAFASVEEQQGVAS